MQGPHESDQLVSLIFFPELSAFFYLFVYFCFFCYPDWACGSRTESCQAVQTLPGAATCSPDQRLSW